MGLNTAKGKLAHPRRPCVMPVDFVFVLCQIHLVPEYALETDKQATLKFRKNYSFSLSTQFVLSALSTFFVV